jgi:hypothetical protein
MLIGENLVVFPLLVYGLLTWLVGVHNAALFVLGFAVPWRRVRVWKLWVLVVVVAQLITWGDTYNLVAFLLGLLYGAFYHAHTEYTGGSQRTPLRPWFLWRWLRRCYGLRVHDAGFTASSVGREHVRCIFAASPHGVNAFTFMLVFMATPPAGWYARLGNVRAALLWLMFRLPISREFVLAMGGVSTRRDSLRAVVDAGTDIALLPDWETEIEAVGSAPAGVPRAQRKTGFLTLAYELGVDCVPVWLEGEDALYVTCCRDAPVRHAFRAAVGLPCTPYAGPCCSGLCGAPRQLHVRVGARHVRRAGESLEDYVARWHSSRDALETAGAPR